MLRNITHLLFRLIKLHFTRKNPKKVLLVAEYSKIGGTRTYFLSLLQFLKTSPYEVTVLMNNQAADAEIDNLIKSNGFKTLSCDFDFWCIDLDNIHPGLTKKDLISYQLKEMLFWCDIIKKHSFSRIVFSCSYPGQYLYIFLLPIAVRYILHTQPIKKADRYKRWLLSSQLSTSKKIITVSQSSKIAIEKFWLSGQSNKHVNFLHNFYEPKYKVKELISTNGFKRILTIGAVEEYKNPFFFIECAKQILAGNKTNTIIFTWAGDGSLLPECRNRTKDFPQIQFVGNIENVEELYAAATIYFQPSLQDSHGIAVLGAMYHKLPCVVSDNGGLKESVKHGVAGCVVNVVDTLNAVAKINDLLNDESVRKLMGDNGYNDYKKKFTRVAWEQNMNETFY
ncbi:MAG: glycosyltransferase family 4 protein [Ferruginibacter sp.]